MYAHTNIWLPMVYMWVLQQNTLLVYVQVLKSENLAFPRICRLETAREDSECGLKFAEAFVAWTLLGRPGSSAEC